jgi:hypothetical protein
MIIWLRQHTITFGIQEVRMINLSEQFLLMIEPDQEGPPSESPVDDELTREIDYIYSKCNPSEYACAGTHRTRCGKNSDWILPNGVITNSLCKYYVRFYRDFIPESEIDKINRYYAEMRPGK